MPQLFTVVKAVVGNLNGTVCIQVQSYKDYNHNDSDNIEGYEGEAAFDWVHRHGGRVETVNGMVCTSKIAESGVTVGVVCLQHGATPNPTSKGIKRRSREVFRIS